MIKIGLVGYGGFGREVMPHLKETMSTKFPDNECFFVDNHLPKNKAGNDKVILEDDFLSETAYERGFNIAISDSQLRQKISNKFINSGCKPISIKARNSLTLDNVEVDEGSILCAFTHITSNVKIGKFFHCNFYSYIAHDCEIGDFVTFAPRVCCNGNVHIHNHAYIGTGAVIKQGTNERPLIIGEGATIGMGAIVTKDVAPFETVVGNPAKPLK